MDTQMQEPGSFGLILDGKQVEFSTELAAAGWMDESATGQVGVMLMGIPADGGPTRVFLFMTESELFTSGTQIVSQGASSMGYLITIGSTDDADSSPGTYMGVNALLELDAASKEIGSPVVGRVRADLYPLGGGDSEAMPEPMSPQVAESIQMGLRTLHATDGRRRMR